MSTNKTMQDQMEYIEKLKKMDIRDAFKDPEPEPVKTVPFQRYDCPNCQGCGCTTCGGAGYLEY